MSLSDSAINGHSASKGKRQRSERTLFLFDLPDALLIFLNNFLDFDSLLSFERVSKGLLALCKNPHSCYQLSAHIHSKLISHLNACASIMEENGDIDSEKVFNYFHSIIARFVHVKHLAFVSYPLFKSPSHIIDYLHHNLYSPIAAHSQFSAMDAIDWRRWEPPRWKTRLIDQLQPPLSFSVQTAHLTCDAQEIIPQLYDVERLDWCSSSLRSSPFTDDSLPHLLLNENRFNLQTLHIGQYKSSSTDSDPYRHHVPVKGIYLQRNGLFFNEFNDINIKDYHQKSTQNLHTIHTMWGQCLERDTVFFFYNICKLFLQTIRSLHISDDVLQMPEYKDIYQDMTLNQLEELCLTIKSDVIPCRVEDDIVDLPFHSGYKYFQTPNVTRLNFCFCFNEGWMLKNKLETYDFNRFCNSFAINMRKLKSLSLHILSSKDTQRVLDDVDDEEALLYAFWNMNVVCVTFMEFIKSAIEEDRITRGGVSFCVYLWTTYCQREEFILNHCRRIVQMAHVVDALWCKYPYRFNTVKFRCSCTGDFKILTDVMKAFESITKYPHWMFERKKVDGVDVMEMKRVNQNYCRTYCKSAGYLSHCHACIPPVKN